jgi:RNA polymerase sigma-70 factor, ECF subfamily
MSAQMDFADLYTRHAQSVFRFAYFLSGNRELAEDIAAETFARALTARNHIRPGSVKAYLLAVARNLFLDWTRTQGRMRSLLEEDLDAADPTPDPEEVTAARLDLEATQEALQHLPERERAALLMAAVGGLPHEQIAASLGCSVPAIKLRIHRARVRLRHLIAQRSTTS